MEEYNIGHLTLLIFTIGFTPLIIKEIQLQYYRFFDKIFFVHFYFFKQKLNNTEIDFLKNKVRFYNTLSLKERICFNHRVYYFMNNIRFLDRRIHISQEMKLLISSTVATLTFGYRKFSLPILENIIVYPEQYRSTKSNKLYKGEFNPKLRTLVFSWKDFLLGFESFDDNINLGIHEFTHVLHSNSVLRNDINSVVFKREFNNLINLIKSDKKLKSKLIKSGYFRDYAFKNKYELLAVLIEHFIETPKDLKVNFPKIYQTIKKMLNFNFGSY